MNFSKIKGLKGSDIKAKTGSAVGSAKIIQEFINLSSRKSIMTMASPGIYQYPVIMSSAIDTDIAMAIAKAYQITYAASVATAYSLNPIMYTDQTKELSDFVKKFHDNNPALLNANLNAVSNTLGVESAMIDTTMSKKDIAAINSSLNENIEDKLAMESLNDMYKPYMRTERIMREKLETLTTANEGKVTDTFNKVEGMAKKINDQVGNGAMYNATKDRALATNVKDTRRTNMYARDKQTNEIIKDAKGNPVVTGIHERTTTRQLLVPNQHATVVRNNQLEALEPTMVNVQIVAHGSNNGNSSQSVHNLTLGVKAVSRLISTQVMIANMIEACKESHFIFKFLKWTKGEIKTLDALLGWTAAKNKAMGKNSKNEALFLQQSKKRKKLNGVGKFVNNEVCPTLSIVITTYEAAKIKEATNIDLTDLKEAIRLMNKYYLLSFAIYDTEQNMLRVLFDCDNDWGYTSVGTLKSAVNKTNDLLNANEIMKVFGRR